MGVVQDVEQDFKSQFYNLQGTHINDRKKNFLKLLDSSRIDIPEDQIDIQPRNYQERIFYVDVLIHFKKVDKLTEILKEDIGVLSSRILKQQWFFQEAFKSMSEENIVNKFLPALSYSLRMKVLKKLSLALNEQRMNKIFDLVLERYGLFIAQQFLFSCSPEKIVLILRGNQIILLPEQLKRLLQKNVDLIKVYFEEYKKNMRTDYNDSDFLNYLAWKHPNLYFELGLNTKCGIKLGRYTTRTIVKTSKEDVLKDIQNSRFNKSAIVRELKEFDKEYFYKFFPQDMNDIRYSYDLGSFLTKYPIKKRWEVLSKAFKQAYNKEIVEHLSSFDEKLAKFFPEEIKRKWAEIHYLESDSNQNLDYIKYCDSKKAFKILKDRINVTSDITLRGRLLNELINVCYENKDYSTYEEVLKYICIRHRNDDKHVRSNLITYIAQHIDYNVITEAHWKYINEIIDIQRVREESLSFTTIAEYLLFVYKKKLPLHDPIVQYAKDCVKTNRSFRLGDKIKEPEAENTVLKHIVTILPTLQFNDDDGKEFTYNLLSDIVDFNKDIKNDKIFKKEFMKHCIDLNKCAPIMDLITEVCTKERPYSFDDFNVVSRLVLYNCLYSENPVQVINDNALLDIIKFMSDSENYNSVIIDCMLEVIQKNNRNIFENTLLDYFFNKTEDYYTYNLTKRAVDHFLPKEPEVIAEYFNQILSVEVQYSSDVLNYNIIKKYSHLELDKKLISYFTELVSVDSTCDKKVKLLNALSKIMKTKDFLDLVKDYIPDTKKLDLNNEKQREKYQVQCDIAKAVKNLDETSILVPVLMDFCQGDYLQSSLAALYSVLYRINEEKALSYINILGGRAMSTRKHAVFLGFKLLSLKDATTLYMTLSSKETNISAKKYLFDAVLKYFLKNPLETLLDIVFLNMDFIDKNDTEMIKTLVESVGKIPNKDAPLFFEKVWSFLDILEQQEVRVVSYRNSLLYTVNQYEISFFLRLTKDFVENLIKKYFLSSDDRLLKYSDAIHYFVINYLLAYLDELHFQFVFNIIKCYKDIHWGTNNRNYIKNLFTFFTCSYSMFDKNDITFLKLFSNFWQHLFNHEESFSEYVLLRLMILYKENSNIEVFSKEVDKFFQELTGEYGAHIIYSEFVTNSVEHFYQSIPTQNDTDFNLGNFALYLLKSNSSEFNCYLAFNIIKNLTNTDQQAIYNKVLEVLQTVNYFTTRVYCNVLLKKN